MASNPQQAGSSEVSKLAVPRSWVLKTEVQCQSYHRLWCVGAVHSITTMPAEH